MKTALNGPFAFLSLQAGLDLLSVGHMLADVVAIIGKFLVSPKRIGCLQEEEEHYFLVAQF